MTNWNTCRNVLCIRADNMGDVIMSGPAIRSLKQHPGCKITLLTSAAGSLIAPFMPAVDDVMVADLPWVQTTKGINAAACTQLIADLKSKEFDAVIIFTVYSQSPLPSALIAYMAGIPLRLAYCRENPYGLLTDWVPDKEPYCSIMHQVERDLLLLSKINIGMKHEASAAVLTLVNFQNYKGTLDSKLHQKGVSTFKKYILLHAGVSDAKRTYPVEKWRELLKLLRDLEYEIILTGSVSERALAGDIIHDSKTSGIHNIAGELNIGEWISLISNAALVVSVNTSTIHIAAAVKTPVIVLYALTNPQHTPWNAISKVLPYSISSDMQSKNEVIQYVNKTYYGTYVPVPEPAEIFMHAQQLLGARSIENFAGVVSV
ncbi:glycosyltransferase family 9 protein [Danxiaibacter flavus]|uniref:Glycosyltransferase family 9 protein n=1 Tax=Danxiaibacter flavus TaxID=3049108 RepID=A0ABV3ZIS4_9BACT|nr:glycosyltransferase family 9 protein [Chitinophagaceae bacterium DXS]